jgi:hypothetical protein
VLLLVEMLLHQVHGHWGCAGGLYKCLWHPNPWTRGQGQNHKIWDLAKYLVIYLFIILIILILILIIIIVIIFFSWNSYSWVVKKKCLVNFALLRHTAPSSLYKAINMVIPWQASAHACQIINWFWKIHILTHRNILLKIQ